MYDCVESHRIVWDPTDPTIWFDFFIFIFIFIIIIFLSGIHLGKIIHLNPQAQRVMKSPIMN